METNRRIKGVCVGGRAGERETCEPCVLKQDKGYIELVYIDI